MNEQMEILVHDEKDMEHIGEVADRVVEKAGQSMVARQEQNNAPAAVTPMTMIDRALISGAAPETLEKLLALQERWEANQGRKAFDEAMSAAKAEIPVIIKNRTVDFTSSKGRTHYRHEDLAEIARTVNPILGKHGLSYRFRTSAAAHEVSVTCIVSHRLGYFEENTLVGRPDDSGNKNSLQQVGSTLTYLQRMTLKAALGLAAAEDDDGRAAGMGPDAGKLISAEQRDTLLKLMEETGTPTENFCQWAKIEAVPQLPAVDFDKAIQVLEMRRRKAS